jgi:hypothetical protein
VKLLTATRETQGEQPGDFCHAIEGELVLCDEVCATDRENPDGGCGCGRAFAGMNSHRATTTAMVRELDLDEQDVVMAVIAYFTTGGLTPDLLGAEEFADMIDEVVLDVVTRAEWFPVGTVLSRRLDYVRRRT